MNYFFPKFYEMVFNYAWLITYLHGYRWCQEYEYLEDKNDQWTEDMTLYMIFPVLLGAHMHCPHPLPQPK
jgi:hypothetical protein